MSETLQTSFNDVKAQGKIVLFKNYLENGGSYYGCFDRKTVNTRTLIARIQARKAGTNELNVQEIAGFLKEENGRVSIGKEVLLRGRLLKVEGEGSCVFLCPLGAGGKPSSARSVGTMPRHNGQHGGQAGLLRPGRRGGRRRVQGSRAVQVAPTGKLSRSASSGRPGPAT